MTVFFQPRLESLVMANARRLIKANKSTSNSRLYSELFGTGYGTARKYCCKLGLDPDSNVTNYNDMMKFIIESEALE